MTLGIRCLLCESEGEAIAIAGELDRLNQARRRIENEMKQQAEVMLQDWALDENAHLPWGLCLHRPDWHQGVIGILASRIKDKLHRPVIIFADGTNGELKGSARSIPGLHIRDTLDEVAVRQPGLLQRFGGHAMAAGLTLRRTDLEAFATAFDSAVRARLRPSDLSAEVHSDGELSAETMNLQTAERIADGGPWGQGFEEPVFDGVFDVVDRRIVGEKHWKFRLRPAGSDEIVDAIAFNAVESLPTVPDSIHAAYRLDRNQWQGRIDVQLRIIAVAAGSPMGATHEIAPDQGGKGQKK
jgi:single-stranded-DNA-specific exonuclease